MLCFPRFYCQYFFVLLFYFIFPSKRKLGVVFPELILCLNFLSIQLKSPNPLFYFPFSISFSLFYFFFSFLVPLSLIFDAGPYSFFLSSTLFSLPFRWVFFFKVIFFLFLTRPLLSAAPAPVERRSALRKSLPLIHRAERQ